MKFVLLVVLAIAILPADSRGFPDKPVKRDFAAYQEVHFPSDSNKFNNEPGVHNVIHNTKNFPDGSGSNHSSTDEDLAMYTASLLFPNGSQGLNFSEVIQQSLEERKEGYEEQLRATCNDKFNSCQNNAKKGLCKNNPFMMYWCTKACDVCGGALLILTNPNGDTTTSAQFLIFHTEKLNWIDSASKCQSLKSRLAVLISPHVFHTHATKHYRGEKFWLAAWDAPHEGLWSWFEIGTPLGSSPWDTPLGNFPWGPGQPSNSGNNQDCMEWGYRNNFNDGWCDRKKGFVCEHASWKRP